MIVLGSRFNVVTCKAQNRKKSKRWRKLQFSMLIWMFRTGLDEIGLHKHLWVVQTLLASNRECCPFLGLHFVVRKKKSRNAYANFMLKFQHVGSPTMDLLHTGYLCSHWSEMPDWNVLTMTQWHYISSRFQRGWGQINFYPDAIYVHLAE